MLKSVILCFALYVVLMLPGLGEPKPHSTGPDSKLYFQSFTLDTVTNYCIQ